LQVFLYSKPLPVDEFTQYLEKYQEGVTNSEKIVKVISV